MIAQRRIMKKLRLCDNKYLEGDEEKKLNELQELKERIVDKKLGKLMEEGVFIFPNSFESVADIDENQKILERQNDIYRTGNVMGFLGYKDERLTITSRFSNEEDYFVQYLMMRALELPNFLDLEIDVGQNNSMFDFLLFLFPYFLKRALRKGVFKKYVWRRYNDCKLKGNIDVKEHLKKNIPFTGLVAYSQREFSHDNEMMELIRHTIEEIRKSSHGKLLLASVKEEVNQVIQVTPNYQIYEQNKVIRQNLKSNIRHPYFYEYIDLKKLCIAILHHKKYQICGGPEHLYGIIFDGAWLWEEYLNTVIKTIFYHPKNKKKEGTEFLFNKKEIAIYPDFIGKDKKNRIIADAKYKIHIENSDYFQLLAYMLRFDAKNGYLLYPYTESEKNPVFQQMFLNKGMKNESEGKVESREISVIKYGLEIPNMESYEAFAKAMQEREKQFLERLLEMKENMTN